MENVRITHVALNAITIAIVVRHVGTKEFQGTKLSMPLHLIPNPKD